MQTKHTIGDRVSILPCTSQRKTVACSYALVFVIARTLNLLNRDIFFFKAQIEASAKGESRSTKGERFTFLALLNSVVGKKID